MTALSYDTARLVAEGLARAPLLTPRGFRDGLEKVTGAARYTADLQIARPPLVPRAVVDRVVDELARVQLPATVHAFKARAEASRADPGGGLTGGRSSLD